MTHSGHRLGSKDSILGDWVLLSRMPHSYSPEVRVKMKKLVEICAQHNPVCISCYNKEGQIVRYMEGWEILDTSGVHKPGTIKEVVDDCIIQHHVVFNNKEDVVKVISELKEIDLGIPIVVTGLIDEVFKICNNVDIKPYAVNLCCGTSGKLGLLPEKHILELVTMCGHGRVSSNLAKYLIENVKKGEIKVIEAAVELGKQCTCNIFNPDRGAKIIQKAIKTS